MTTENELNPTHPLPWRVMDHAILDADNNIVFASDEDRAFIVASCNAYKALVAALIVLHDEACNSVELDSWPELQDALSAAGAALSEAGAA